jgi:hypothetical protein
MTTLSIGTETINTEDILQKVESDVAFLTDRLQLLSTQNNSNPVIIETYQGMLESRQDLLAWLLQDAKKVSNG